MSADASHERIETGRIVRAIDQDSRPIADEIHATHDLCLCQTASDKMLWAIKARSANAFDCGESEPTIGRLMFARKRHWQMFDARLLGVIADSRVWAEFWRRAESAGKFNIFIDDLQFRANFFRNFDKCFIDFGLRIEDDCGNAALENTSLFTSNLGKCVAKNARVIEINCGHDCDKWSQHIRRIQSAAESNFNHCNIDGFICEVLECHRSHRFEECWFDLCLRRCCLHFLRHLDHRRLGDHPVIDGNALAHIDEMWTCIKPNRIVALFKHVSDHCASRTFSNSSCNMHRLDLLMRISHRRK